MMSSMRREDSWIRFMVATTPSTAAPPSCEIVEAWLASVLAWAAYSAFCCTESISCFIEPAICASAAAWVSVRLERSRLPLAISAEAEAMASVPPRTRVTMLDRLSRIALIANSRLAGRARSVSTWCCSWPSAIARATPVAYAGSPPSWPIRLRATPEPMAAHSSAHRTDRPVIQ
jgi:hypothetical protein